MSYLVVRQRERQSLQHNDQAVRNVTAKGRARVVHSGEGGSKPLLRYLQRHVHPPVHDVCTVQRQGLQAISRGNDAKGSHPDRTGRHQRMEGEGRGQLTTMNTCRKGARHVSSTQANVGRKTLAVDSPSIGKTDCYSRSGVGYTPKRTTASAKGKHHPTNKHCCTTRERYCG